MNKKQKVFAALVWLSSAGGVAWLLASAFPAAPLWLCGLGGLLVSTLAIVEAGRP